MAKWCKWNLHARAQGYKKKISPPTPHLVDWKPICRASSLDEHRKEVKKKKKGNFLFPTSWDCGPCLYHKSPSVCSLNRFHQALGSRSPSFPTKITTGCSLNVRFHRASATPAQHQSLPRLTGFLHTSKKQQQQQFLANSPIRQQEQFCDSQQRNSPTDSPDRENISKQDIWMECKHRESDPNKLTSLPIPLSNNKIQNNERKSPPIHLPPFLSPHHPP